jgi:hypothetical protein
MGASAADFRPAGPLPPDRSFAPCEIDAQLRRLAGRESACRLALGRLATRFLKLHGQHTLGFARLGDYTRERLGISARELQGLARVASALRRLPDVAAAFATGELSWSHVRILISVATPDTEAGWVALGRRYTVRGLEALVGRHSPRLSFDHDGEATIDGEPRVIFHLPCPRHVRVQWRQTLELARRMAGAPLRTWEAAEGVAAEALSGAEAPPSDVPADAPSTRRPVEPLTRSRPDSTPLDDIDLRHLSPQHTHDPFTLDERMRLVMAAMQRIDSEVGRLLLQLIEGQIYRVLGFNSLAHYAHEHLGISDRKARALLALERRTTTATAIGDAYRQGNLSWLRTLTILPVAAERVAAAWVERARAVTTRRLVDEVQWALDAKDASGSEAPIAPPPLDAPLVRPERQTCAPGTAAVDAHIVFAAPASIAGLLRQAIAAFSHANAPSWRGFERVLEHVRSEWQRSPRHPDPVFARDGWRCAVPGCSSRRNLHDHHLLFRSRGGSNARDNRVTVCAWHHLRGIHDGRIRAHGAAPHSVTWELGVRRGGPPLMRLVGDRYD